MIEQEFIDATDLRSVQFALHCIKNIVPGNSTVVDSADHLAMVRKLKDWETQLYLQVQKGRGA